MKHIYYFPRALDTGFTYIEKYGSSSDGGLFDGFKTNAVVLLSAKGYLNILKWDLYVRGKKTT